ncbi:hypothetical protein HAX54_020845, partial [Datura stramonium]|nr:hypothetical protein [Datura stramonium]
PGGDNNDQDMLNRNKQERGKEYGENKENNNITRATNSRSTTDRNRGGKLQRWDRKREGEGRDTYKEDLGVDTGQEVQERAGDSRGTVLDKGISAAQRDISPLKKLPTIVSHQEGEVEFTREENENIKHEDGGLDAGKSNTKGRRNKRKSGEALQPTRIIPKRGEKSITSLC